MARRKVFAFSALQTSYHAWQAALRYKWRELLCSARLSCLSRLSRWPADGEAPHFLRIRAPDRSGPDLIFRFPKQASNPTGWAIGSSLGAIRVSCFGQELKERGD